MFNSTSIKTTLASAGLVAVIASPFAIAQTTTSSDGPTARAASGEGSNVRAGVRNPSADPNTALTRETEIIANSSTYGTRQSNKSGNGGGAIYGCRSGAGGTRAGNEPCIRSNNLEAGLAFEFETDGNVVGTINGPNSAAKPFTTNATGVADGLNADRVDGIEGAAITTGIDDAKKAAAAAATAAVGATTRWALVNENGEIEAQSGGFALKTAYPGGNGPAGNQNVYLDTGADVTKAPLGGTIAIQNTNQDGVASNFGGEISVGACGLDTILCAPDGTENANTIVISPRKSDGTPTEEGQRKRFYVTIG